MKIAFSKEWCIRMAQLEMEADADAEIGSAADIATSVVSALDDQTETTADANFAFGRFVRLLRRNRRQTLEHVADQADIEIDELVEIEEDTYHRPEPRSVYQLAKYFDVPMSKMMQVAGLSAPKDAQLYEAAIKFAARSETVEELNDVERAALEAFVSVLSEKE